jgi:hypothetical protein
MGAFGQQGSNNTGVGGGILGIQGGGLGQFGQLGGQFGLQGGTFPYGLSRPTVRSLLTNKITYEEYKKRTTPDEQLESLAKRNGISPVVPSAAAAATLGEPFEYAVPDPVTLPRFKSALVPVANAAVDAARVSIYNPAVLERYPLAGVKFVNKTGRHLAAGPLAVYDGETFAGDARIPALKPNDTRLVSYAVDLHVVARTTAKPEEESVDSIKLGAGTVAVARTFRRSTDYAFANSAAEPRTVLVEHAVGPDWKVVGAVQPTERTRSYGRFDVAAKANGTTSLTVSEERKWTEFVSLNGATDWHFDQWLASPVATPAAKEAVTRAKADTAAIAGFGRTIREETAALKAIADEQARIRANIERVPRDSDAYKRYLKKFDDQETDIERRQAKVKDVQAEMEARVKAFEEYVKGLKAE